MEAWTTLARHTLEAEFPRFDIIHAFAAFEIPRGANARKPMCPAQKRNLERLAEAFGTPNLCVEFLDSWPNAVQAHEGFSCSAWEAWARAIKKAEQVGRACSELKSVAQHGMCFVPSTSGVEQSFSGIAAVLTTARLKSAPHHEQQAVNLLAARLTPAEIETLASEAQSLWKDVFMRHSRQHLHQRCDIGVHRPRKVPKPQVAEDGKKTENNILWTCAMRLVTGCLLHLHQDRCRKVLRQHQCCGTLAMSGKRSFSSRSSSNAASRPTPASTTFVQVHRAFCSPLDPTIPFLTF